MAADDKVRMATRIFLDNDIGLNQMLDEIAENPNRRETPAQFQESCAQKALAMFWQADHQKKQVASPPTIWSRSDMVTK